MAKTISQLDLRLYRACNRNMGHAAGFLMQAHNAMAQGQDKNSFVMHCVNRRAAVAAWAVAEACRNGGAK